MVRYLLMVVGLLAVSAIGISISPAAQVMANTNTCIICKDAQVTSSQASQMIFLPSVSLAAIPRPPVLLLPVNDNYDNSYTIEWQHDPLEKFTDVNGDVYSLTDFTVEESSTTDFAQATRVFKGPVLVYTPQKTRGVIVADRRPGVYYYRVKANEFDTDSLWSNTQAITIFPLFVGLNIRWDSVGYIRGSWVTIVGHHLVVRFTYVTEGDTLASQWQSWYAPNPIQGPSRANTSYYSATTGVFRSSTGPDDPSWKWGAPIFMPYTWTPQQGKSLTIGGQPFSVRGPLTGYTAFGTSIQYWEMVNERKFRYWDGGGDTEQRVGVGDIVLRYHAGASRLLLYESTLRHFYEDGDRTGDTVQYITQLSASSALEGSGPVEPMPALSVGSESQLTGYSWLEAFEGFGIAP